MFHGGLFMCHEHGGICGRLPRGLRPHFLWSCPKKTAAAEPQKKEREIFSQTRADTARCASFHIHFYRYFNLYCYLYFCIYIYFNLYLYINFYVYIYIRTILQNCAFAAQVRAISPLLPRFCEGTKEVL